MISSYLGADQKISWSSFCDLYLSVFQLPIINGKHNFKLCYGYKAMYELVREQICQIKKIFWPLTILPAFKISIPFWCLPLSPISHRWQQIALGKTLLLLGSWPAFITMVIYLQLDFCSFVSALIYYRSWLPVNVVIFIFLQLVLSFCKLACILFAYLHGSRNRPIIFPKLKQ